MTGVFDLLLANAAISAACFAALWLVSLVMRDVTVVDSWWPFGMVMLAGASFVETGARTPHKLVLLGLCVAWGVRLGVHLLLRWRREGPDRRYIAMIEDAKQRRGWGFALSSLLLVFALQAPLQFIVALPVQLGQAPSDRAPLGPLGFAGAALAVLGLVFETVGDRQLTRFKADAANKGLVMDKGLWRYTRHPNYFGDACLWWGLFLIAAETPYGLWSAPGPILITLLLTRFSGVPTVESRLRAHRPGYEDYVRRTSAFAPWFPKGRAP
ncbi:MAG TPA: DUF1295 domain-containing protein [Caulobacteraceae bacterium]